MSTANFNSNQLGFPLYVHDNIYAKVCPECGAWNNAEEETCFDCGASLEDAQEKSDWVQEEWLCDEVKSCMDEINKELAFFEVGLMSGYYVGVQFDVNFKMRWGCELDPEEMDNDDAHYYFDCCRSVMLRKYERERRKLAKKLKALADDFGFEEIVCVGVFSNGEAVYRKVEAPKEMPEKHKMAYRAKVAAKAVVSV